jgi:hypothetical protein
MHGVDLAPVDQFFLADVRSLPVTLGKVSLRIWHFEGLGR